MADSPSRTLEGASPSAGGQDEELVERFARGDGSAFDRIVAEHRARVTALAYRLLGWSADVEDVVQEVFLAALKGLPKFRGQARFSSWLTRIVINKCRTHRRRRLLRLRWQAQEPPKPQVTSSASTEERMLDRETFERVHRAIQGLPMRYREVVVLRYLEEMPIEAMSEVLGTTTNTIQVRLHRARARLKESLAGLIEV